MSRPTITQEYLHSVLDYNYKTGEFRWKYRNYYGNKWGWNERHANTIAGSVDRKGYWRIKIEGILHFGHSLAWLYVFGEYIKYLDHKNLNKSDNRIENLRKSSQKQNCRNRAIRVDNKVGFKGVIKYAKGDYVRYVATCNRKHLGYFKTPEEAHAAYCAEAKKQYGEFARFA